MQFFCKAVKDKSRERKESILSQFKYTPDLYKAVLANDISFEDMERSFFGSEFMNGKAIIDILNDKFNQEKFPGAKTIDYCADEAICYAFSLTESGALLMKVDQAHPEFFSGWLTSENFPLYINCVSDIKMVNFKRDSPLVLYENLAAESGLPAWLMVALEDSAFKISDYKHQKPLSFVFDTLLKKLIETDPDLGEKMRNLCQRAIVSKGDPVQITSFFQTFIIVMPIL